MKNSRIRLFFAIASLAIVWTCLCLFRLQRSGIGEIFWTTILFVLCSTPSLLFLAGHKFRIPFMPMWGTGYFMLFGMPLLSRTSQPDFEFVPEKSVVAAIQLAVYGAGMCLLTFYSPLGKWVESLVPQWKTPWNPKRAAVIGTILCVLGTVLNYYQRTSPPSVELGQIFSMLAQLAIIGMVTLFLLQLRGCLSWQLRIFLWGIIVPLEILTGLGTGAVYNALIILAPFLFCYSAERRKIPWIQILVVLLVCFVPFSGFKGEFRSYSWYGEPGEIALSNSPVQRGVAFVQLVTKRLSEGGLEAYTVATESAQARVSHLNVLITVMRATPTVIPFWRGETYTTLFWTFIPRFIFPSKPEKTLGQKFGHRYGFLSEEDYWTSINLPHQVVEMYINFGTLGVFCGMAFLGLLYRALATLVSQPNSGERNLVIGCAVLTGLLTMDSDFSLVIGNLIYYLPLIYIATRGLKGRPAAVTGMTL